MDSAHAFERVMVFIDGSNFYKGCVECFHRADIDFARFSRILGGERKLIRTVRIKLG